MPGDVGLVAKFLTPAMEWLFSKEGLSQWQKVHMMRKRAKTVQEMMRNARDKKDWDAVHAYIAESERLSVEP